MRTCAVRTTLAHALEVALALALALVASPAAAHDVDGPGGKLGDVHFAVTCNAAAQKEFNLAMGYYHSFAWEEMKPALESTLAADGR